MQTPADFLNKVHEKVSFLKEIISCELEKSEADGFSAQEYLCVLLFFQAEINGLTQVTLERSSLDAKAIETIRTMANAMENMVVKGIHSVADKLEKMN